MPIFVRLANYASAKQSLREYILGAFGDVGAPKEAVAQILEEALSQGGALILLDGLDEVMDDRAGVIREIENFNAGLEKGNQVLVTSRRSSYSYALGGAFKGFDLNNLEQDQIRKFLQDWNFALEKQALQENGETFQSEQEKAQAIQERAQKQFASIAEKLETNVGAQNLAKNPLTLRMLAEAYRWQGELPNRRVDLYTLIVKRSLEFWEVEVAGVPREKIVTYDEALDLLCPLAFWMHSEKESPSESEIKNQLKTVLKATPDRITPTESISKTVDDFWTRVRERTGLFIQDTPNHYRFVHDTFREFFAGLYLVQDRAQAAQRIYAHRHQARWEEPILLGISFVSTDESEFASELIRTAILAEGEEAKRRGYESSRYEDVLHRDFFFAVRCVADGAKIDQALMKELAEQLVDFWFEYGEWGDIGVKPVQRLDWSSLSSLENAVRFALASVRETETAEQVRALLLTELENSIEGQSRRGTRRATNELEYFIQLDLYGTIKIRRPYEGLKMLGLECTPPLIKFFMQLRQHANSAFYELGGTVIEDMARKKEAMMPALEEMLNGNRESKLFAAILLGEYGVTTPEAVQTLCGYILEKDSPEDKSEGDPSNPDFVLQDRKSRVRDRKQTMQNRALNALLEIKEPTSSCTKSSIAAVLWSHVEQANRQIESLFVSRADNLVNQVGFRAFDYELHDLNQELYPYDQMRLTAAFLLCRLDESPEALNILRQAILKPISHSLALYAARRLASIRDGVSDEIIDWALQLSESSSLRTKSFSINLLKDLQCKQPAIYARLISFLDIKYDEIKEEESFWGTRYDVEDIRKRAIETLYTLGDIPVEYLPKILELIKVEPSERTDEHIRWQCVKILADTKIDMPLSTHLEIAEALFYLFRVLDPERDILKKAEEVLGCIALTPDVMRLMLETLKAKWGRLNNGIDWAIRHHLGKGNRIIDPDSGLGGFVYELEFPSETIQILLEALCDTNPHVNEIAGIALGHGQGKSVELVSGLRELLKHPDAWVRYRAMDRLVRLEYKEYDVVETWLDLLKFDDEELRVKTAELAGQLPALPVVKEAILFAVRNDTSPMVRAELLGRPFEEQYDAIPELKIVVAQAVNDPSPLVRSAALLNVKYRPWLFNDQKRILEIISNPDPLVNEFKASLDALPEEERSEITSEIDMEQERIEFRQRAIQELGKKENLDRGTLELLFSLLDDPSGEIRASASESITKLFIRFPKEFVQEREEFANYLYGRIKNSGSEALGIMGLSGDTWGALWAIANTLPAENDKRDIV